MKTILLIAVVALLPFSAKAYECVEVHLFDVDRNDFSSRALSRATEIPEEMLNSIQTFVLTEINVTDNGLKANKPDQCENPEKTLVLSGKITDYKKGNRAVRYIVGFGAGKQKIQIQAKLMNKGTGQVLAEDKIVDRKIGGLVGGSANKGQRDFAEKVDKFIRKALKKKKTKS